ncbi:PR domain zinc finger protein 14-like [Liolophura sinensis]|uniref:PR domain zinc finger protein 14-like n=1 Tax=Liolophura sinensis TaxID=3198878 RepID=UPI0031580705
MPAHSTHGVFSTIRLECGVRFGPYTGKKVYLSEVKSKDDNSRMWEVFINGQLSHFIDGRGACANWMTYVRCARTRQEQNLVVTQHDGQIFYEVCDVIEPSKELLVWYGTDYDLYLGIPTGLKLTNEKGDMKLMHQESRKEKSSDQGYQCDRCGRMFAYNYYRDKHLKYTRCVDSGNRKFPCDLCPRSFEKRDRLRIHVLHVHEKHRPHSCHVCQKTFSQSSSLNKHMRVHNGERPYKCVFCGKSFTASSILRTHIRQHSGEKPFKCKFCGKAFASHAAHDSHVRRTHAQFGRVPDVFQLNDQFPRNKGVADVIRDEEQTTRRIYQESITSPGELTRDCISPGISVDSMAKQNNRSESGQAEDDFINVDE